MFILFIKIKQKKKIFFLFSINKYAQAIGFVSFIASEDISVSI
jgi:hypothetical protein